MGKYEKTRDFSITSWDAWIAFLGLRSLMDNVGMLTSITTIDRGVGGRYHIKVKSYERRK